MAGTGWIPNRTARWLGVLLLGLAGACVATLALSPDGSSAVNVTICMLLVVMLVLAIRYLRAGLQLDPTGFVSRGDFWTHELRWSDVADIEVRGFRVGARLTDGRWLTLFLAQRMPPERDQLVVALRSGLYERT